MLCPSLSVDLQCCCVSNELETQIPSITGHMKASMHSHKNKSQNRAEFREMLILERHDHKSKGCL